ncbi:MAG: GSCFA domain-containing protein [Algoriphagus sp.]|uniref:GSCFA domain-containing protein n=1 Tax=Algoriphagus sp. TaxID=1872435 RepID=UPI00262B6761|nr:GSCFA domain-containing protein [Algoriphagus sp.]MDG1277352.1 GSCFA domain-containing protein [Algoriphagus sp.]
MKWSIDFPIPNYPFPISHQSKILSLGSCFAQTIGQKMIDAKFDCLVNPFGTIFNPISLEILLKSAFYENQFEESLICERDGLYFHYYAHSDLWGKTKTELLGKLQAKREETKVHLEQGTHLVLTLGSAWVYDLEGFKTVANCHKQPGKLFNKRLLTLEEMESRLLLLFDNFSTLNPNLKVILTVSPVRHIKDGISENQLSKSQLRVLCANLERRFSSVSYFPAYEIMMDELRDYRFYKSDLIHPNEEAENYIWQKWQTSHFDSDTIIKTEEIRKVNLELAHRPLNPKSDSHHKFLEKLIQKLERLNSEFDFSKEIIQVQKQLDFLV